MFDTSYFEKMNESKIKFKKVLNQSLLKNIGLANLNLQIIIIHLTTLVIIQTHHKHAINIYMQLIKKNVLQIIVNQCYQME